MINYSKYPNLPDWSRELIERIHSDLQMLNQKFRGLNGPVPDLDSALFEQARRTLAECNASIPPEQRTQYTDGIVIQPCVMTLRPGDILAVQIDSQPDPLLYDMKKLHDRLQGIVGPEVKVLLSPGPLSIVRKEKKKAKK